MYRNLLLSTILSLQSQLIQIQNDKINLMKQIEETRNQLNEINNSSITVATNEIQSLKTILSNLQDDRYCKLYIMEQMIKLKIVDRSVRCFSSKKLYYLLCFLCAICIFWFMYRNNATKNASRIKESSSPPRTTSSDRKSVV